MRDWAGKRYWVVGASEGIGREVALALSRLGVELVVSARSAGRLDALLADLSGRAEARVLDVTDNGAVAAAGGAIGHVDGLVYLAGLYWPMHARDWDADKAVAMADVNFLGALRCVGAVLPEMVARGDGHIVLMGSLAGLRGMGGSIGYGASKAAVVSLAESLRADLKDTSIAVQVINPGYVRTRMTARNDFPMPFLMEPDVAAREVVEHMNTDRFVRSFPAVPALAVRGGRWLPDWAWTRLTAR